MKAPVTEERLGQIEHALADQERTIAAPPGRHIPIGQSAIWLADLTEALRITLAALDWITECGDPEAADAAQEALTKIREGQS